MLAVDYHLHLPDFTACQYHALLPQHCINELLVCAFSPR